ncbi:hypothetical protein Nos7524_1084 [Nostoc sp. PCC 7524]|nr:hypothetical protein Nos7524_1084 [Nostoc sp. PCC 7524]
MRDLSREAGGRGQEAGGKLPSLRDAARTDSCRDGREQAKSAVLGFTQEEQLFKTGFKTPTESEFSGFNSGGVESYS